MDIQTAIQDYLNWKSTYTIKASLNYKGILLRFSQYINKGRVEDYTINDVTSYVAYLKTHNYAYGSINLTLTVLKNFFKYWSRFLQLQCDSDLIRVPRNLPKLPTVITTEEYRKLCELLNEDNFGDLQKLVMLGILWDCGLRVSELVNLNVEDIKAPYTATILNCKTRQYRFIVWSDATERLLRKYLLLKQQLYPTQALFCSLRGGARYRVSVRTVQRWINALGRQAHLGKNIHPHTFRHSKAHRILEMGGNIKHIQAILGHSENNPLAAFRYLRLNSMEFFKMAKQFL